MLKVKFGDSPSLGFGKIVCPRRTIVSFFADNRIRKDHLEIDSTKRVTAQGNSKAVSNLSHA